MTAQTICKRNKIRTFICILIFGISNFLFYSCGQDRQIYYKNADTGKIYSFKELGDYCIELRNHYADSLNEKVEKIKIYIHCIPLKKPKNLEDSIIRTFNYDIKIGTKYLVRQYKMEKIGMELAPTKLLTFDGDSLVTGGVQEKPTLINLWFIECPGCIAEIPVLNKLQEKYAGKMHFIAITFEDKVKITQFLQKQPFNFTQISDTSEDFIKKIASNPYPENIFIDKQGIVRYIEGAISQDEFEEIIEELINQGF